MQHLLTIEAKQKNIKSVENSRFTVTRVFYRPYCT